MNGNNICGVTPVLVTFHQGGRLRKTFLTNAIVNKYL